MKYFLLFFLLFNFGYFKNLSAYYKVSIKNLDDSLNQDYFSNRLISELTSTNQDTLDFNKYFKNFFYDKSQQSYQFEIDINSLNADLILKNIQFNLNLLNCSLVEGFFTINVNKSENNCPTFNKINSNDKHYIYITNSNISLRLKEVAIINKNTLKDLWINFLSISSPYQREYQIRYKDYSNLTQIINYYPDIVSYKDQNILLNINHFYSNDEINFLLGLQ
jgi:hypothetical protein